jgi:hypothetical protein
MAISQQNIFDSFNNYLILTINKCLGNLALGDKIVGRYSIHYLKVMVEDLKRQLPQADFNKTSIPSHISKELLNINSTNLSDPSFYKLRSDLYEIISICYLDEAREDYIENMHTILQRIFELDLAGTGCDNPVLTSNSELSYHALQRCDRPRSAHEVRRHLSSVPESCLQGHPEDHQRQRPQTDHQRVLRRHFAGVLRTALFYVPRQDGKRFPHFLLHCPQRHLQAALVSRYRFFIQRVNAITKSRPYLTSKSSCSLKDSTKSLRNS